MFNCILIASYISNKIFVNAITVSTPMTKIMNVHFVHVIILFDFYLNCISKIVFCLEKDGNHPFDWLP